MAYLPEAIAEGIVIGGVYALLGIGFHLMFGVLKRLNLAYGPILAASVYLAALVIHRQQLPWFSVLPIALGIGVAISAVVERLAFAWVRGDARFSMVATLGIWMLIEEVLVRSPGRGRGQAMTNQFDMIMVPLGPIALRLDYLLAFALSSAICLGLYLLLYRTGVGLKIRCVVADRVMAEALRIDASAVIRWTFALAAVVGVLAGFIFATLHQAIDAHFGMWATLKGLVILVLGGVGSFWGVVGAAFLLGIAERVATELAGHGYHNLVGYGLMLALLTFFPFGIGGRSAAGSRGI